VFAVRAGPWPARRCRATRARPCPSVDPSRRRPATRPGKDPPIPENPQDPIWDRRPDGSRVRLSNGIRIVDRTGARPAAGDAAIEHLVTWRDEVGSVIVLGLDETCRPVYTTTLFDYR
jgi:hypothetical protein